MTQDMVWLDGAVLPADEARISVFDMGFLRGIAGFESLRTYGGHPHALDLHLERLWTCARAFGVAPLHEPAAVRDQIAALLSASGHRELRVNCIVTPGRNTDGLFGASDPTWVVIGRGLIEPPPSAYERGIATIIFHGERLLPHLKTTNYFSGQRGMLLAQEQQAAEAFYCDDDGLLSEGVTSNLLILRGDTIVEPDRVALPGITKHLLRPVAAALGLQWTSAPLRREDLLAADEVWISSSVRELMAVVSLDGEAIGDGRPGPWAATLRQAFHQSCIDDARRDAGA